MLGLGCVVAGEAKQKGGERERARARERALPPPVESVNSACVFGLHACAQAIQSASSQLSTHPRTLRFHSPLCKVASIDPSPRSSSFFATTLLPYLHPYSSAQLLQPVVGPDPCLSSRRQPRLTLTIQRAHYGPLIPTPAAAFRRTTSAHWVAIRFEHPRISTRASATVVLGSSPSI